MTEASSESLKPNKPADEIQQRKVNQS